MAREEEDDDIVCLDPSFFINDNYQLTRFTFGSQVLELYCLHSASIRYVYVLSVTKTSPYNGGEELIKKTAESMLLYGALYDAYCVQGLTIFMAADFDLTGQLVWPGAELLNDYLSKNAEMLQGCSVIELGSGVGITGMLCSRFCSKVVMTDHNDEVLKILRRNIELHRSSQDSLCSAGLEAEKLEWGNSDQLNDILQRHPGGFDLVLGADICFQQSNIPLLFNTVEKLLRLRDPEKCKFILAYVSRAKVMDDMVIREAYQHGLHVSEVAGTRATVRFLQGVIYEITCR